MTDRTILLSDKKKYSQEGNFHHYYHTDLTTSACQFIQVCSYLEIIKSDHKERLLISPHWLQNLRP